MTFVCAFPGCCNNSKSGSLHSFHCIPLKNTDLRILWLNVLQIDVNTSPVTLRHLRVCSAHFSEQDFIHRSSNKIWRQVLKNNAVPSHQGHLAQQREEEQSSSISSMRLKHLLTSTLSSQVKPVRRCPHQSQPQTSMHGVYLAMPVIRSKSETSQGIIMFVKSQEILDGQSVPEKDQRKSEPLQIKEECLKPELPQIKREQEPEPLQVKEEQQEEPLHPQIKDEGGEPEIIQLEEDAPVLSQIKDELEENKPIRIELEVPVLPQVLVKVEELEQQKEPVLPQIKDELEEKPVQMEWEEPVLPQVKIEVEELEHIQMEQQEEPVFPQVIVELEEPEPIQIKQRNKKHRRKPQKLKPLKLKKAQQNKLKRVNVDKNQKEGRLVVKKTNTRRLTSTNQKMDKRLKPNKDQQLGKNFPEAIKRTKQKDPGLKDKQPKQKSRSPKTKAKVGVNKPKTNKKAPTALTDDEILKLKLLEPEAAILTSMDTSDTDTVSSDTDAEEQTDAEERTDAEEQTGLPEPLTV